MRYPALSLLTSLALLLQAMIGLSPAWAMGGPDPVPMCHSGDGAVPARTGQPVRHDCLACPACAAATTSAVLVPLPPHLPRPGRLADAPRPSTLAAAPAPSRPPANLPRGPPRLA